MYELIFLLVFLTIPLELFCYLGFLVCIEQGVWSRTPAELQESFSLGPAQEQLESQGTSMVRYASRAIDLGMACNISRAPGHSLPFLNGMRHQLKEVAMPY